MVIRSKKIFFLCVLIFTSLACQAVSGLIESPTATEYPPTSIPTLTASPTMTATPLPPRPVEPGKENPDEPVFISGEIPYTSPFFLDSISEAFVMLEDQGGFVTRDIEYEFPLVGQALGPVELLDEEMVAFQLALPAIPQGTQVDVDNDQQDDEGVQVFAVAYWSNTWGGPFLEKRDGTGWSTGYASTKTDADREDEIDGGTLIVWSPDDTQGFPSGFGEDGMLFTADDPILPVPAGYTLVNLDQDPFIFYKDARPYLILHEGDIAVNDFSALSYIEAFDELYEKVSREYPFTADKSIHWDALYDVYAPRIAEAGNDEEFFLTLKDFSMELPDGHIGVGGFEDLGQIFFENYGGSFGLILAELSDGRVLVTEVLPDSPAEEAGIEIGAEITKWNGQPITDAIAEIEPFFGPYSTIHHKRIEQLMFLTRVQPEEELEIGFKNPGDDEISTVEMEAIVEYDSLFAWIPSFAQDELTLPIEAEVLDESGLGYIKINTFSDDYNLMAQLWDRFIREFIEWEVPGIIIDMRVNSGGSSGLARDYAGYFFEKEVEVMERSYYNDMTGQFEYRDNPSRIIPGPVIYDGPVAILIGPYCVSACEGFSYSLTLREDVTVLGHTPSSGAFGEVGRGQYDLPGGLSMQFPTGRSESMDGRLLIEGTGVVPDIQVPITEETVFGDVDAVLDAAVRELIGIIE